MATEDIETLATSDVTCQNRPSAERKSTRDIIEGFAANTSLHGAPHAILAKSRLARCFWTLLFFGAVSMFGYQLSEIVRATSPTR